MTTRYSRYLALVTVAVVMNSAHAAEHRVSSAADVARVLQDAKPGDELVMTDGDWKDQVIHFKASGADDKPITLRAQTPGKVIYTGESSITVEVWKPAGRCATGVERGEAFGAGGGGREAADCAVLRSFG